MILTETITVNLRSFKNVEQTAVDRTVSTHLKNRQRPQQVVFFQILFNQTHHTENEIENHIITAE